jgi:hypothetical protein
MNARDYSALPVGKVAPKPHGPIPADFLVPARVQPCFEGMDDVADYAQTLPRIKPTDIDALMELEDAEEVEELFSQRPTPNGKWMGIAIDACAQLIELQRLIGELDFFSAGDTGLGRLQQESQRANEILQRAGYRNENAA